MYMDKYRGKVIALCGYNAACNTTDENLADHSTLITYAAARAAAKVQVSCANAADAAAGTGARKIKICGLDADYMFQSEEITLNGQAYVESALSYRSVFSAEVSSAGTGLTNAGIIYIIITGTGGALTAGVPATLTSQWIQILAGASIGTSGLFTVPAGSKARLIRMQASGMAQPCILSVWSCDQADGVLKRDEIYGIGSNQNLDEEIDRRLDIEYPEKVDIYLRGLSTTAAGRIAAKATFEITGA
jgi:hypothetical protein